MISFSYNLRISLTEGPDPFELVLGRPGVAESQKTPLIEYGLSLEDLNERVLTPFATIRAINIAGRSIHSRLMERIEIRAVRTDSAYPRLGTSVFDLLLFEYSGIDVSKELIKNANPWDPKIGADDTPEAISIDLLYDRLVTSEPLRKASRQLFRDRHFARAVEQAFVCVNNAVKDRTELRGVDNRELMQKAFSVNKPLLRLNEGKTDSDWNEQLGYMELYAGSMSGIRNPRAHEQSLIDKPAAAIEMLAFANHLMNKLDQAKVVPPMGNDSP